MKEQSKEKGAELVETAFVILLFLILVLGVFEFGRAYNIYQNITSAARDGARFAVAPQKGGTLNYPNKDTEVKPLIEGFLQSANLDPSAASINILTAQNVDPSLNCTPCPSGGCPCGTTVTVSYPFSFLFFGSLTISTSVTMRNEA